MGRDRLGRTQLTFTLAATAGLFLCVVSALIALSAPGPGDRPLIALGYVLLIGVPIGVGLWAWSSTPYRRFGGLLLAAGFLWFVPTLAASDNAVVFSVGWVGIWLIQPVVAVLMLAFPSGRLTTGVERALVWALTGTIAVLYLPSALIVEQFPKPAPNAPCGLECPDNAFMILDAEPGFVGALLIPARELIAVLLFVGVLVVLARRIRRATALMRRTLLPVLAVASVRAGVFVLYFPLRRADPTSPALDVLGWIWLLCLPGIALAFLVGLLRMDLAAGEALRRMSVRLRGHPSPDELTTVLRETLNDPTLELVYWSLGPPDGWVDAAGKPVLMPTTSGRCLTEVRDGERPVAGLIHDAALQEQPDFVQAAGSLALTALENQRLEAKVGASLEELRESRARIQAAADSERRRIERDLHDGAQQRLVALRIRLGLAGDLMGEDPARGAELLRELGAEAEDALEEVRSLAHGMYPPLLADQGLGEALRALARRTEPTPRIAVEGIGRYPPEIESVVYFCCLEALQNVAKHAAGASTLSILVVDDGELRFEVRDDGPGFSEEIAPGVGLTNMADRLAAVGGELDVRSGPGGGTLVAGRIPSPKRIG